LQELFGATLFESGQIFRPFEFYTVAAIAYYVIAKSTILASRVISARLFRY
jgi:polar amino acid transport system permease protein